MQSTVLLAGLLVAAGYADGLNCAVGAGGVPEPPAEWIGWKYTWQDDRFNHWLSWLQFHCVKNFTVTGFEMVDTPPHIHAKLEKALLDGMAHSEKYPKEGAVNIIVDHGNEPDLIYPGDLVRETHNSAEMIQLHEDWCGVPLTPTAAFGFRVYRRGNVLKKHVDRVETHIISSIVHIGREVDEPWHLMILDNDGVPTAVELKPGKMLFYESARLMHWREARLQGTWYASLFQHYKPVDWPLTHDEVVTHLPDNWNKGCTTDDSAIAQDAELPVEDHSEEL